MKTQSLLPTAVLASLVAGQNAYPACHLGPDDQRCINDGRFLVPELNFSNPGSPGDLAYSTYLPTHPYTLSAWPSGGNDARIPRVCGIYGHNSDGFDMRDFQVYNVTFPDQCPGSPWVICRDYRSGQTIDQLATVISKIPVRMRQAMSTYMVYRAETNAYHGAIGTLAGDGLILGLSSYYFPTALVHETGHAVDSEMRLLGTSNGSAFSDTDAWKAAYTTDGYAVSAYGAGSSTEDFAEAGRAVLLDIIYPGGLAVYANHTSNLTHITNQVNTFKSVAGQYYTPGGSCDLSLKFPFPELVGGPYAQCGGQTYSGITECVAGYICTFLSAYYSQCLPAST
ncbi:hypothetical protein GQ53DRAFT_821217 [Thozetella sp. PMI_491]|nr:hypothetical protein GQ53DRAFT_821217 [Thozetella sp. PMI_491]